MNVTAIHRNARMSPKKVMEVTRAVQGLPALEAIKLLKFIPRKSAALILEVIKSAVANAEHNFNLDASSLIVSKAVAEMGTSFKRFRPASKGSAHPYLKRTCHIRVVLTDSAAAASR